MNGWAELGTGGLLEAAPDAIVGVDAAGRIVLVNAQAVLLFGYDREELIGEAVEILVPEAVRDVHPGHRDAYLDDPHPRPMGAGTELAGRRCDGSEFPAEISLSAVEGEDEELMVLAAVRDVTERIVPATEEEKTAEVAPEPAGGVGAETVLVVEDEAALLEVARRVLTGKGYRVLTASRGAEAIELVRTHDGPVDLLLTDVVMPQMLGKDVAREINAISPATVVIFMSGYARPVLASQGTLEPGVLLIEKPFTASILLEGVRAALDRGRAAGGGAAQGDGERAAEELDRRALDELVAIDGTGEALEAVATLFIRDAPARMAALADAGGRGDAPEVHAAAHTLRGTAATFGAAQLAELTRTIELAALEGGLPGDDELAAVRAALDSAVSGLGALVAGLRTP